MTGQGKRAGRGRRGGGEGGGFPHVTHVLLCPVQDCTGRKPSMPSASPPSPPFPCPTPIAMQHTATSKPNQTQNIFPGLQIQVGRRCGCRACKVTSHQVHFFSPGRKGGCGGGGGGQSQMTACLVRCPTLVSKLGMGANLHHVAGVCIRVTCRATQSISLSVPMLIIAVCLCA